ncbi:uncharacterized protein METZ01_LOCUS84554 [marine metagenome]|uniref:Uncharacterized protein n=1 Tax=marine metagenome TaxID=408172 RepID=A0A381UUD2_9ZZZZ
MQGNGFLYNLAIINFIFLKKIMFFPLPNHDS